MIEFLSTVGLAAIGLWVLLRYVLPVLRGAGFFLFLALNHLWLSFQRRRKSR